jgi:hypothetical protein
MRIVGGTVERVGRRIEDCIHGERQVRTGQQVRLRT